jgi:hypothetical protein
MKKSWFLIGGLWLGLVTCQKPVETGSLTVNSQPAGADVYLDDSLTGQKTDCVLQDVPLGRHNLRLVLAGYQDWIRNVELTEKENDVVINAEIADTSEKHGTLQVNSEPVGAEIWLNKVNTGYMTNYLFEVIDVGEYIVELKLAGYVDWSDTVTVTDGGTAIIDVVLEPDEEPVPGIVIHPDTTDSVPAGQVIRYPLKVLNYGNGPDVPEITFTSTQTWNHRILDKDFNDLPDTDADGTPDAGTIPGLTEGEPGLATIYLEVRPPYSALPGAMDSTVVRATSSITETVYDITVVRTITRAAVHLDIDPDTSSTITSGDTARYFLRVTNNGAAPDTIAIGSYASPDIGWGHNLSFEDGSPLTDSDADGDPDLGNVDPDQTVIVRLNVLPEVGLDSTVTETRFVWIRTAFTDDMDFVNDSAEVITIFEP